MNNTTPSAATFDSTTFSRRKQVAKRRNKRQNGFTNGYVQSVMFEDLEPQEPEVPPPIPDDRKVVKEYTKPKPGYYPQKSNNSKRPQGGKKRKSNYQFLSEILDLLDYKPLLEELDDYRWTGSRYIGRRGYGPRTLLRLYFAKHLLNEQFDIKLLERVRDSAELRAVLGLDEDVPSHTVFSRFRSRLVQHRDRLDDCISEFIDRIRHLLPSQFKRPGKPMEQLAALGEMVAVDTTVTRSWANGNNGYGRREYIPVTDHDARWGYKNSGKSKDSEPEYIFGYRIHLMVDATHGLPIGYIVTSANESDNEFLLPLVEQTLQRHGWLQIKTLLADRGYDDGGLFHALWKLGIDPIIKIRKPTAKDKLYDGIYGKHGAPMCLGGKEMEFVQTDAVNGKHEFRCPPGGCHLKAKSGWNIRHCDIDHAEDPAQHLRALGGRTARASKEWKAKYRKRWEVERWIRSAKASRGLEHHRQRRLPRIELLTATSVLTYLATALSRLEAGDYRNMRKMRVVSS